MDARYGEARRPKDEAKSYHVLELDNSSRGELASSAVIAVARVSTERCGLKGTAEIQLS